MLPGSLPQFLEDMQEDCFLSNITATRKSTTNLHIFQGGGKQKKKRKKNLRWKNVFKEDF